MTEITRVTILGATGSVGQNTLAVLADDPRFTVHALSAHRNTKLLLEQCQRFRPRYAVITEPESVDEMAALLRASDCQTELLVGEEGLLEVVSTPETDVVMAAIVGGAGLASSLAAVQHGKRLLLANKEALVMSGELFMQTAAESGAQIIPIDSEHNAIFQCLPLNLAGVHADQLRQVEKIVLTSSGGPFLNSPTRELSEVTPEQACKHPNWSMGRKISVDSATMMNKGLEFIEACYLFGVEPDRVEVLIHPQSIVHSMVHYRDGSVLAQLANPDMRVPIAHGLAWPERMQSGVTMLDLAREQPLQFLDPDYERFPCLALGMEAARRGGGVCIALNAANEVAVKAFLDGQLPFLQIAEVIAEVVAKMPCEAPSSLAIIQDRDRQARKLAKDLIIKNFH
ncbi:MAG: 1-deoxy-D-xylulose-5-phosphate reductoisomerase [Pseudohongiellaceae bacterium]